MIVFPKYLSWHFIEVPQRIFKGWKNFLRFGLYYFSIPLLLRTLFYYWHGYHWTRKRGFDIGDFIYIFLSNLILRIIGLILRLILIIIGIFFEISVFLGGILIFLIWFGLPIIFVLGLVFGIKLIRGGPLFHFI